MKVRIFQPSKSTMQSGRGNLDQWVLEYETTTARKPEDVMGWTAAGDTLNQVQLNFNSAADAVKFAQGKGRAYNVQIPHERKVKARNYGDAFKYRPVDDEA